MTFSFLRVLVILACIGGTFLLLQGVSGVHRTPIQQPLANFPTTLGNWLLLSSHETSSVIIKMLGVDDYIEFNYSNSIGQQINFYAAFYESVGNGGGFHSPKNCIPGGGWGIEAVKTG